MTTPTATLSAPPQAEPQHAKHVKTLAKVATGPAATITVGYLFHLAMAFVLSWALSHGFHISIGVFPLSLTTFFGRSLATFILQDLSHAWHKGQVSGQHQGQQNIITKMAADLAKADPDGLAKILGGIAQDTSKGSGPYL